MEEWAARAFGITAPKAPSTRGRLPRLLPPSTEAQLRFSCAYFRGRHFVFVHVNLPLDEAKAALPQYGHFRLMLFDIF
jgi:hypothetical protein